MNNPELSNNETGAGNIEWTDAMAGFTEEQKKIQEGREHDPKRAEAMAWASKEAEENARAIRDQAKEGLNMTPNERAFEYGDAKYSDTQTFADQMVENIKHETAVADQRAEQAGAEYDLKQESLKRFDDAVNRVDDTSTQKPEGLDPNVIS